jgi:hypothetical protein
MRLLMIVILTRQILNVIPKITMLKIVRNVVKETEEILDHVEIEVKKVTEETLDHAEIRVVRVKRVVRVLLGKWVLLVKKETKVK